MGMHIYFGSVAAKSTVMCTARLVTLLAMVSGNHPLSGTWWPGAKTLWRYSFQGSFIQASNMECKYFIKEERKTQAFRACTIIDLSFHQFFQNEEIEAMAAIYGEEWCVIDDCAKIFCIRISDDIDDPKWTLCLQVFFSPSL